MSTYRLTYTISGEDQTRTFATMGQARRHARELLAYGDQVSMIGDPERMPDHLGNLYYTADEIEADNEETGRHFFERESLRFFNSRVLPTVVNRGGRAFFVTSERYDRASPRLYTIREARPNGSVITTGEFQGYRSARAAYRAIEKL